jgi:hypothetical protein
MASNNDKGKKDAKNARDADRLAAALRENLRRRKVQARGRQTESRSATWPKSDPNMPDPKFESG